MTPPDIARLMVATLETPPDSMVLLDPACGDGKLLVCAAEMMVHHGVRDIEHRLIGVDIDRAMLTKTRDNLELVLGAAADEVLLLHEDFLEITRDGLFQPEWLASVNAVISNPPYGRLREYRFFDACNRGISSSVESVFLMPVSFVDRVTGPGFTILPGKPMGVTTGHVVVHHSSARPYTVRSTRGRTSNSRGVQVLSGIKLYEVGAGTPPQTREMLGVRPYSSAQPREGWLPCLRTGDIRPYDMAVARLFVEYGPHLAHPKDLGRFVGPKVFLRRMPMWDPRCLGAAYTHETLLCAGDVLVIRHETDDVELLRGIEAYLNSDEAAAAIFRARPSVLHRTSYPKVSAKDIHRLIDNHLPSDAALRRLAGTSSFPKSTSAAAGQE